MPYDGDSFFTLSMAGRVGLLLLSAALSVLFIVLSHRVARGWPVAVRPILALLLFWLFVWLSPQVYYLYYRFLIPDLPLQWVLKTPPGPLDIVRLLIFQGRETLSDHGKALLGWGLIAAAVIPSIRSPFQR